MEEKLGKVTIAPEVLITIARLTTLSTPGVVRMSTDWMGNVNRLLGRTSSGGGVRIEVEDEAVTVDLHVIAEPGANMYNLGQVIQAEVTRAINDMVGVTVRAVNIHIEDVEEPLLEA
ncbi:MAG: Asp23/Gls24 family envelope stress response protein [Anaerolineae bacterium]|nr:Asp23/Gls24 family envelope stress response protein [Anaerolineae bacterium]